jgi:superfamily II DNA or RNA helicase
MDTNIFQIKSRIQEEACQSIINNGGRGLLAMATGSGKSKAAIDYLIKKGYTSIALIVPTENLRDNNWKDEFLLWSSEDLWNNTTKLCYASASKLKGGVYDCVILDEVHRITELSSEFFENNEVHDIVALSATIPNEEIKLWLLSKLGLKVTYSLTIDEAEKLSIISPYNIIVVYTYLNTDFKVIPAGSKKKPFLTTEEKAYNFLSGVIKKLSKKTGKTEKDQRLLDTLILKRMQLIYNLPSKTKFSTKLLKAIKGEKERIIIFCGSKDQADQVCNFQYYSGSKGDALSDFKSFKIDVMSCVNKVNEGENIPNLDKIVIVQLNSNDRDLIQRIGRVVRFREGHRATIYIIVCKDTQDEVWLKNAIRNIDPNKISYKLYSQFNLW